jgi:hypothetical protein
MGNTVAGHCFEIRCKRPVFVLADVRLLGLRPRSVIGGTLLVKLPSGAALPLQ